MFLWNSSLFDSNQKWKKNLNIQRTSREWHYVGFVQIVKITRFFSDMAFINSMSVSFTCFFSSFKIIHKNMKQIFGASVFIINLDLWIELICFIQVFFHLPKTYNLIMTTTMTTFYASNNFITTMKKLHEKTKIHFFYSIYFNLKGIFYYIHFILQNHNVEKRVKKKFQLISHSNIQVKPKDTWAEMKWND